MTWLLLPKEKTKQIVKKEIIPPVVEKETPEEDKNIKELVELSNKKIDEIFDREKEIELKEQKIQDIEEKIEKQLATHKKQKKGNFFSKEFVQGIIIGILISVILFLIYNNFFA